MKITFLGDLHGKFSPDGRTLIQSKEQYGEIIQIGDVGLGFPQCRGLTVPDNFRFFAGNHDNPETLAAHPNFMGDYGIDPRTGIFFLGGAYSVDKDLRIEGRDWWPREELSMTHLQEAIDFYAATKPEIVATHTCPASMIDWVLDSDRVHIIGKGTGFTKFPPDRTSQALQAMLEIHRPRLWVFGHFHFGCHTTIDGTEFRCLAELEHYTITK